MTRVHDADLCKRIRDLEKEVERLKTNQCHHYHWYPQWTWTAYPPIYSGTHTTGAIWSTSTVKSLE